MLRVGLTGGVGSGKTTVAAILRDLGAHLNQSDEMGRALMQPGQPVAAAIAAHFGPEAVSPDGTLNRAALARIAFSEGRVEELNAIVHPAVLAELERWNAQVAAQDPAAVAVVESALIFETRHSADPHNPTPWRTRFDRMIVVTAPVEVRRQRYIARLAGSISTEAAAVDFDRRAAAQWTDEQKAALADFVLPNTGSLEELHRATERIYAQLLQESQDRAAEAM